MNPPARTAALDVHVAGGLAMRCARQVTFDWTADDDRMVFGMEVREFLAPGLLADVRTSADLYERLDAASKPVWRAAVIETFKGQGGDHFGIHEALLRIRSGVDRWHWIAMRGNVTGVDARGRATRMSGVVVDETERETQRRDAVRMRDLYAMLSACNRAVSCSIDRHDLLQEVCDVAVRYGRFALCWVGLGDADSGRVQVYAQAGGPADYPSRVTALTTAGRLDGGGLTGRVIREQRAVVHNDLGAVAGQPDWLPMARAAGFRGIGGFPLYDQEHTVGAIVFYANDSNHFDARMIELLEGLGNDVSRALDHLAIEEQQAQTLRQLEEANRQFKTAMSASLDGMLIIEGHGEVVEINAAARQLLGCGASEVGGLNFFDDFTPEREHEARRAQIRRLLTPRDAHGVLDGAHDKRTQTWALRADRREVPVELLVTPLRVAEDGRLMLILRDMTESLRQRDELIQAAQRFERIIEQSPDGMFVQVDGVVVLCNERLRQMLGAHEASDLVGRRSRDLLCDGFRDAYDHSLDGLRSADALATTTLEAVAQRLDGGRVEIDILANLSDFHGSPARQVVFRDISARKRMERLQASQQAVLNRIAAREPLHSVLLEVARTIESHTPHARCAVLLVDETETLLCASHSPSIAEDALLAGGPLPIEPGKPSSIVEAAWRREPVFVSDTGTPIEAGAAHRHAQPGAKAVAAWPLLRPGGKLMGVIYVAMSQPGLPSAALTQLVRDYSDLTAVAIDNDRQATRIRHLAQHDVLTGLPNRALFKELLDQAIERSRRRGRPVAALFVDLDRFKVVNDTFGHDVGDTVLTAVAQRLKAAVREGDRVARMGGDEFYLLLDDLESLDAIGPVAERVLEAMAEPLRLRGEEHNLSGSIGIAVYPRDGDDSDTLLKHADIAMYRAKAAGRAGYSFFAEADNEHTAERYMLQSQMRGALQRREFVMHYQPRVDVVSGRVCGVEALVRWLHPERGLVMPGDFIPVAEDSGQIIALGWQIMEMAFTAAPRLRAAADGAFTTAVNLSALQLGSDGFVDGVRALVAATGVEPHCIEFELTESVLLGNPDHARRVIEELRAMGFEFAIDDFGTGYASLTYLKRFPVQCVKIDRSFVQDIPGDVNDLAITRAIVAMAHSLSIRVVAEGVETLEQLAALQQMDCHHYQGWYHSKALPLDQVLALILAARVPSRPLVLSVAA